MLQRSCRLLVILAAVGTTAAAVLDEDAARPNEVPGWGRVLDPWRDCDVSLDLEHDRLKIKVPGTPHVLSAEAPELPMNAPRVVRRVRGDFTASVRVLGRLEPGRSKTTHYDPFHGAGLIVWQDPSNYLRLERAVGFINGRPHPYINYELREDGRLAVSHGITIEDRSLFLKLRRRRPDVLRLVQPRRPPMGRACECRRELRRTGRGRRRRRQLFRTDAVGRTGEAPNRGPSWFDGSGLCGRRLGEIVHPLLRHRRQSVERRRNPGNAPGRSATNPTPASCRVCGRRTIICDEGRRSIHEEFKLQQTRMASRCSRGGGHVGGRLGGPR